MRYSGYIVAGLVALIVFYAVYHYQPFQPIDNPAITPGWTERILTDHEKLNEVLPQYVWNYRAFDIMIQGVLAIALASGLTIFFGREGVKKE